MRCSLFLWSKVLGLDDGSIMIWSAVCARRAGALEKMEPGWGRRVDISVCEYLDKIVFRNFVDLLLKIVGAARKRLEVRMVQQVEG